MTHSYPIKYDLPTEDELPELPPDDPNMQRATKKTELNKCIFIEVLTRTANITESCRTIDISRDLAYRWYKEATEMEVTLLNGERMLFSAAWDNAIEEGVDGLEAIARHRAVHGIDEPVIHKGELAYRRQPISRAAHLRASEHGIEVVGELELDAHGEPIPLTVRRPSDRLMEILLKAHRPEKFRENVDVKAIGQGGLLLIPVAPEDWEKTAGKQQLDHRGLTDEERTLEGEVDEGAVREG